jgi:hypothetical protein
VLPNPGRSLLRQCRRSLLSIAALLTLAASNLTGCSQPSDTVNGSETHFLEACNTSCASGLECVDGQCSKRCSTDDVCGELDDRATCATQPSAVKACELECSDNTDCTRLLPELTCNAGVCRGPLWQLNSPTEMDASDEGHSDSGDSDDASSDSAHDGSDVSQTDSTDGCGEHPGCPPPDAMYFLLPEEGLGTVRIEFNLDEGPSYVRCSVEFIDDELRASTCESNEVEIPELELSCDDPVGCEFGRLRLNAHPTTFNVVYWQSSGHQTLPLDVTTWVEDTFDVGPVGCSYSCTTNRLARQLPSTKGLHACLTPENECTFGLGCGDRVSALANLPACDEQYNTVWAGEGCGYDVLIHQRYIESERAFYDRETGALIGFWHRSDTGDVQCSGQVPFDCSEVVDAPEQLCVNEDVFQADAGAASESDSSAE